jgi:hypothetical protein
MLKSAKETASPETLVSQTQQMGNREVTISTHFDFRWDCVHVSVKVRTFRRRSINPHNPYGHYHHTQQLLSYQKYEIDMTDAHFKDPAKFVLSGLTTSSTEITAYRFYKILANALQKNPDYSYEFYQNAADHTVTLRVPQGKIYIPQKAGELQDIITPSTSLNNLENLSQEPQREVWKPRDHHYQPNHHQQMPYRNPMIQGITLTHTSIPDSDVEFADSLRPSGDLRSLNKVEKELERLKAQYDTTCDQSAQGAAEAPRLTKIAVIENQLSSMVQRLNAMDHTFSNFKKDMMDQLSDLMDDKIATMIKKCPAITHHSTESKSVPVKNIQITKSKKQDLEPVLTSETSNSFYLSDLEEEEEKKEKQPTSTLSATVSDHSPWNNPESHQPFYQVSSPQIGSNVQIHNRDFVKRFAEVIKNSPYGSQIDLHKLWYYETYKEYLVILHQSERYTLAVAYKNQNLRPGDRIFLIHNYGGHVEQESVHFYRCLDTQYFGEWKKKPMMAQLAALDAEYEGRLYSRMTAIRYYTALEKIVASHFQ